MLFSFLPEEGIKDVKVSTKIKQANVFLTSQPFALLSARIHIATFGCVDAPFSLKLPMRMEHELAA